MWGIIQISKLVNFPWQTPPLWHTPPPPYHTDDVMWCHMTSLAWCSSTPLHFWTLILWLQCKEFVIFEFSKKVECDLNKNSLNNFICHLSWFKKLSPTHTHPLKPICEFLKPYELLFSELESLIKCWMWLV